MIPGFSAVIAAGCVGALADYLIRRGIGVTVTRNVVMFGGMFGGAAILPAAGVESLHSVLFFLSVLYSSLAVIGTAIWALPADIAPSSRPVASIGGIQNFVSNIAEVVSPLAFDFLLDCFEGNYAPVFGLAACIALVGALSCAFVVG